MTIRQFILPLIISPLLLFTQCGYPGKTNNQAKQSLLTSRDSFTLNAFQQPNADEMVIPLTAADTFTLNTQLYKKEASVLTSLLQTFKFNHLGEFALSSVSSGIDKQSPWVKEVVLMYHPSTTSGSASTPSNKNWFRLVLGLFTDSSGKLVVSSKLNKVSPKGEETTVYKDPGKPIPYEASKKFEMQVLGVLGQLYQKSLSE